MPLAGWPCLAAGQLSAAGSGTPTANGAPMPLTASQRLLTLRQAADATGLSLKALRSRADRGQIQTVRRPDSNGQPLRLVPRTELERLGLIPVDPDQELHHELEQLRAELAEQRRLAEHAESAHQVEHQAHEHTRAALHEQRARAAAAAQRSDDLQAALDAITTAGPIKALRLRRRLKTTG